MQEQQKSVSAREALAILEQAYAYYQPEPVVLRVEKDAYEPLGAEPFARAA